MVKGAWVTLATNDSYSLGALVLAHSLKQVGTQKELAILVTPGVTNSMRARLSEVFNSVKEVNILDSRDKANLRLLQRPELGITFTKLHCWQLTEYEKCVFLDADTLVLQNCDELFEREELSAAPDVGWPDCFNSGVFVYRPSEATYNNLIQFALDKGSFDGGDQGLLNLYFSDWARKDISKHLPFIYNVCSTAFYSYLPAFKQFGKDVKIIHFIGNAKPWLQYFDTESKRVRPSRDLGHLEPILQRWWNIFCSMIHPNLTPDMISSYPSEPVSARSPDPPTYQHPPHIDHPVQFDCTIDKPTVWDPWEEYDRNQVNVTLHSSEPLESHNTIALNTVASDQTCIDCSSPVFDESPVDHNDQHYIDNQTDLQNCQNDQHCVEQFPVTSFKEDSLVSCPYNTQEEFCHIDNEIVQEFHNSAPVPIVQQENIVSAIPTVPIFENNPSHFTTHSPEVLKIEDTVSERIPSPTSIIPNKNETEEDCNEVLCEEDNDVQESGLAGAFAKLTLGQQRTPEQEALEDSLRRQNWEQGNIDYLGKDSFDNIWSKICETLAKGPQENEGENSTQLKSDELVLANPQQESSSILKEDVVPASQEAAVHDSSIEIQEKASSDPIPLPPSPGIVETPKIPIPQIPETVSTPEVSATTKENLLEEKSENKISSVPTEATIPIETLESKIVEQVPPVEECAKSGNATEIKSAAEETTKVIEKVASETISSQPATEETSKPQDVPVSTESTTSDKEPTLLSQNVTSVEQQDKIPSTPIMPAPITSKPEDISKEKTLPASQRLSSADPTLPLVQQAPLPTQQVASTAESVPPLVAVCPLKDAPSEETPLKETPSSPVSQVPVSEQTVLKDTATPPLPAEQGSISEIKSCTLIKTSAPEEPPKPEQIAPEKGVESLGEATEKACSVDNAPSTIQAAVQQVPLLPQPATTTPVPIAAQEKASAPVPLDPAPQSPSTATPRSTDASSEPLPPITPPPRKNGGNKKQNKSKK